MWEEFFLKVVSTQNYWTFEMGTQEGINVPIWNIVAFQQKDGQDSQNFSNDTFSRHPVTSAEWLIGTEIYPDSGILLNYDDDDYSQGYGQIKAVFRALTINDILQQYISDKGLLSSNNANDIGYNLFVFDITYQKNLLSAQPIKVGLKFSENIPAGIYSYALVLTHKLVSISSDGQRHIDLI